jgi:hypothetical protein
MYVKESNYEHLDSFEQTDHDMIHKYINEPKQTLTVERTSLTRNRKSESV